MAAAATTADVTLKEEAYIPEKILKAERRIAQSPYDTEAWSVLIRDTQAKKIDEAEAVYERLVTRFPNSGRYWKIYIEHEMKMRNYDRVEKLFQRCLMKILNIDLWRLYLAYIKETKITLPTYREKMAQAYDFALDKIGMDISSFQIWIDYISFLKSVEAVGSYAENQRISAVRKVYQRGIVSPMISCELLWKEYCNFEHATNPIIGKKMQEERSRDYMNSRRVAKEYEAITKGLNKNAPSVPPQNTPDEIKQIELWKKYIAWEKSNPLRTDDATLLTKRVMFAYEQCLLCLDHHPDIWIEAASYLDQASKLLAEKGVESAVTSKTFAEESSAMYERAITTTLKHSILLHFAYADFEEGRMKYDKAHSIYKRILDVPDIDPTLVYIQYMRFARRVEGIKSARLVFKLAREDSRIKYHVYVAAALMEFYCSKDQTIAFKIFELAFRKFGSQVEFVQEYIDYLSHINEENNTRVLFERVLTSGQLPNEKSHNIWYKFLEFEVNVGDLSGIQKVERRRLQIFASELEGKETALLIDRYRYLDLYPCDETQLKSFGYQSIATQSVVNEAQVNGATTNGGATSSTGQEISAIVSNARSRYPRPDLAMMIPFKPKMIVPVDAHPVPGGVFPIPSVAADLLLKIPPPFCFSGPFVIIDKLMDFMINLHLTDDFIKVDNSGISADTKPDLGTSLSIDIALGRKRKIEQSADSDDEGTQAPPAHDIYRQRQQKKIK